MSLSIIPIQFDPDSTANALLNSQKPRLLNGWRLETTQFFQLPRVELFSYFADAGNLEEITPPWLHFEILTPLPIAMQVGALINYRLKLRLIPVRWRTEISVWEPPFRFVDRQLRGPYRCWIHEHTFTEIEGGTLMRDRVHYAVPGGPLVHALAVRRDLEKIFNFRREVLSTRFPTTELEFTSL